MKKIITYGSQYGTAKQYAEKLSEITTIPLLSEFDVKDLLPFDHIIHIGSLYAGRMKGLKRIVKHIPNQAKLSVITVGLADVNNEVNINKIREDIEQQIPADLWKRTQIFHLRGGIDYSRLNIIHKIMMKMLYKKIKALPEEEKTAEIQSMIDTYNQKVDFIDFSALNSIAQAIMQS